MSYLKFKEYKIVPVGSLSIIRNCSGCGGKSTFVNSSCFRINANGNCLDVWLIYQCNKCRHTYNLPIYERVKPHNIKPVEYLKLLGNDPELAYEYGNNTVFMQKNKAEVDWKSIKYDIIGTKLEDGNLKSITILNPYVIKIRTDKVLSEIMGRSRQEIRKMVLDNQIYLANKNLGDISEISFTKLVD
jgi:Uncharacterized protein conserved in bacteria